MSIIIDGTNGISDIDGTASTPAIRGTDANTGIFFPAADTIAFAEGGSEVARIDSSGNVKLSTAGTSILNSSGNKILNQTGSVLQVLSTTDATIVTTSGSTISSILSLSITPSSSSNKILVFGTVCLATNNNTNGYGTAYLFRSTTQLLYLSFGIFSSVSLQSSCTPMFLDSPATTSSTSYSLQIARGSGGTTSVTTDGRYTLTLMEIAA